MQRLIVVIFIAVVGSLIFYNYHLREKLEPTEPTVQVEHPVTVRAKHAPTVSATDNPFLKQLLVDYESFIRESVDHGLAPGAAVAIIQDTSVLLLKGFGLSDTQQRDSVGVFSVFRLGSVSKSLASVLTAKLVEEGVLRWDDPVVKYLPDFQLKSKESTERVTIRHLLSHTSGLPYHAFTEAIDNGASLDPLIYHLRDLNLTGPPGKTYSYQNVAYSVIGKVIESATGKPYHVVMEEKVFRPLGMDQSSLTFEEMVSSDDKARPHVHTLRGWRPTAINRTYYNVGPAGGVNASISDMAKWLRALTSHDRRLLQSSTREEMFRPVVKATARNRYFRNWKRSSGSYYSLGWRVLTFKTDTLKYHGGYVNGYRSEVAIKDDEGLGICVLVNAAGVLADRAIPEFFIRYEKYRRNMDAWEREERAKVVAHRQSEDDRGH